MQAAFFQRILAKAQEEVKPERLALIFATEPVFTAVLSMGLFGQFLSMKQSTGAVLILAGLLVFPVEKRDAV